MLIEANNRMFGHGWRGAIPPQYIFAKRRFRGIALNPPRFEPGSWIGAGKVIVDYDAEEFWMTARPRNIEQRGYAVEFYRSPNGEDFKLMSTLEKDDAAAMANVKIDSIEGTQILRDPLTEKYYLYVSADVGQRQWETLLFMADDPQGPWTFHSVTLKRDKDYDASEARDASISIIDGNYVALYKANPSADDVRAMNLNVAFATSSDGIRWTKHGVLKIAGKPTPPYIFLSGSIFASASGPLFMGFENLDKIHGAHVTRKFASYVIDQRDMELIPVFESIWTPLSPYERKDWPAHGYMDLAYDPFKNRVLMYIEAIDPNYGEVGLNLEVDRLLVYETRL
ncbi:MAG: hypothetical protein QXG97_02670 [Nitrososphaerota archaeon]